MARKCQLLTVNIPIERHQEVLAVAKTLQHRGTIPNKSLAANLLLGYGYIYFKILQGIEAPAQNNT